jgi:hypothetical protein
MSILKWFLYVFDVVLISQSQSRWETDGQSVVEVSFWGETGVVSFKYEIAENRCTELSAPDNCIRESFFCTKFTHLASKKTCNPPQGHVTHVNLDNHVWVGQTGNVIAEKSSPLMLMTLFGFRGIMYKNDRDFLPWDGTKLSYKQMNTKIFLASLSWA